MRAFFVGTVVAALASVSLGCGMITGLSNDYTFVPDDGGASTGGDGGDGGATDGGGTDDGGKCDVPTGVIACNCMPKTCCALAACVKDTACLTYMQCRTACNHSEACLTTCKDAASSETRNAYDRAISNCMTQQCQNNCSLN